MMPACQVLGLRESTGKGADRAVKCEVEEGRRERGNQVKTRILLHAACSPPVALEENLPCLGQGGLKANGAAVPGRAAR